ncbi:hypothetical protein [Streptomyces sp. NPDC005760]|uniref:hypothetical protein n=1 Tax=Streptomyces sp. NPDC005760 TaxID=3156718 RepID=UPI00340379AE
MTEQAVCQHLRELREHFTPPPGLTYPEISDGTFVMTMSPRPPHQVTAKDVARQLDPQLPEGPLDPREIFLAIEIVSPSNPGNDYEVKSRDCANRLHKQPYGTPPQGHDARPGDGRDVTALAGLIPRCAR